MDLDLPDLPYLSGDLPLSLDPLGGGDLERIRRLPTFIGCPPWGGLIGLFKKISIFQLSFFPTMCSGDSPPHFCNMAVPKYG